MFNTYSCFDWLVTFYFKTKMDTLLILLFLMVKFVYRAAWANWTLKSLGKYIKLQLLFTRMFVLVNPKSADWYNYISPCQHGSGAQNINSIQIKFVLCIQLITWGIAEFSVFFQLLLKHQRRWSQQKTFRTTIL